MSEETLQQQGVLMLLPEKNAWKFQQYAIAERQKVDFLEVLKVLTDSKLPFMPMKGMVLSHILYNDYAIRSSSDIDIAVLPSNHAEVMQTLKSSGYRHAPDHSRLIDGYSAVETFSCPRCATTLEMHFSVSLPERFGHFYDEMWIDQQTVEFQGFDVQLPKVEVYLIYLITHLARHIFYPRALWVEDIRRYLAVYASSLNWDFCLELIRKHKLANAIITATEIVNRSLDKFAQQPRFPHEFVSAVRKLQSKHGKLLYAKLLKEPDKQFTALDRKLHCFGLSESWRDRWILFRDYLSRHVNMDGH